MEGVEGVEEFLLRAFGALQELDVVYDERVGVAAAGAESVPA
jgi:hypothetical protein